MQSIVGLTQRVMEIIGRGERRDALDQAWYPLLTSLNIVPLPIPNRLPDPVAWAGRRGINGLILSGGNNLSRMFETFKDGSPSWLPIFDDVAPERDRTESRLLQESIKRGWPVLGVCRGMQMLNVFYGGNLSPLSGHAGIIHSIDIIDSLPGYKQEDSSGGEVNSFHDYGVSNEDLAHDLKVLARTRDGTIEACSHNVFPHFGIMWHPERNVEPDLRDIELISAIFNLR